MSEGLPGATAEKVTVDGVALQVYRSDRNGGGTDDGAVPVLLLHGVPETSLTWRAQFESLAARGQVLAADLPGLGGSDLTGEYGAPQVAGLLAKLVRQELGELVDVVGHDFGGVVALALAGHHPGLVRRLVVVNAPFRAVGARALHLPVAALPALPEALLRLAGPGWLARAHAFGWKADRPAPPEVLAAYAQAYAAPGRVEAMLGWYRAAVRRRAADLLRGLLPGERPAPVDQPRPVVARTLVVWGAGDPVLPLSVGEAAVKAVGGDVRLLSVPGAGHFVHEEAPEVVTPALVDFLSAEPGPTT